MKYFEIFFKRDLITTVKNTLFGFCNDKKIFVQDDIQNNVIILKLFLKQSIIHP